ncbi:glyoxylase-like metal-dependent hydrolase (beta-lactamase superfamily II) [Balneicella halophila]|uniref:Glyoxylase-like metal-dependent hydrolase (Beta-lactamase superfamily II) n=1 Tax=Balneicella halophila TaxID=1537566 RepID=A0A7L4UN12_BALHA|nr:MBL fold metallo-hydrolase [Balneicella halophila]PVX49865.1 glyoxylase-like metal-dependent hydrolase (beta-lactamase superfamily II) [Balneicella halophila]
MKIKQFEFTPLAHYSYAIISGDKMAIVDPSRNPLPYYNYAEENDAKIVAVFETHLHADFISSHLQIHNETGATVYVNKHAEAKYPHKAFNHNDTFKMNDIEFRCIYTPGHSRDSICILAESENKKYALFTGDTLFISDIGRPDLREAGGETDDEREKLARMMFETIQTKFSDLRDDVIIYPTHGAGSLCGKGLSEELISTLGKERRTSWAFQINNEEEFVKELTSGQPFIPNYFSFNVEQNRQGVGKTAINFANVEFIMGRTSGGKEIITIDMRGEESYKDNHLENSINIMCTDENDAMETWLGSIVKPNEQFEVIINSADDVKRTFDRISSIGYDKNLKSISTLGSGGFCKMHQFCYEHFKNNMELYTIVDVRNKDEYEESKVFENALNFPLDKLMEEAENIPTDKPIVVHCGSGYRSSIGSSIIHRHSPDAKVLDMGEYIKKFN